MDGTNEGVDGREREAVGGQPGGVDRSVLPVELEEKKDTRSIEQKGRSNGRDTYIANPVELERTRVTERAKKTCPCESEEKRRKRPVGWN